MLQFKDPIDEYLALWNKLSEKEQDAYIQKSASLLSASPHGLNDEYVLFGSLPPTKLPKPREE